MPLPHFCSERHNIVLYPPHEPLAYQFTCYLYLRYHSLYIQGILDSLFAQLIDILYYYYRYPQVQLLDQAVVRTRTHAVVENLSVCVQVIYN